MKLVNKETLMKSFEAVLGSAACTLNGYEIWEVLNSHESIDAIPVEWIKEQMCIAHNLNNDKLESTLVWLIDLWQKGKDDF